MCATKEAFESFCVEWAKAVCTERSIWDVTVQMYRRLTPDEWAFALDTGTRNMLATAWSAGVKFALGGS